MGHLPRSSAHKIESGAEKLQQHHYDRLTSFVENHLVNLFEDWKRSRRDTSTKMYPAFLSVWDSGRWSALEAEGSRMWLHSKESMDVVRPRTNSATGRQSKELMRAQSAKRLRVPTATKSIPLFPVSRVSWND